MRRGLGFALAALLVFAACSSDGDDDQPSATVPTVGSTTTTNADDEFAIPAAIDEAYVQRVLAELDRIDGDATRIIIETGDLVPEATERLQAVYLSDELNAQLQLWDDDISDGLDGYRHPPGDVVTDVTRLVRSDSACVVIEVRRDFTKVSEVAGAPRTSFITLRPKSLAQDTAKLNNTPWMIAAAVLGAEESGGRCE